MLIPHEDKVVFFPNQHIVLRRWRILNPHEDKVDVITPFQHIGHKGWRILIPHEDNVDIISPINILFCYVTIMNLGER